MRGYDSSEEHTEAIKIKINKVCRPQDKLFILGDGFLNSTVEQVEDYLIGLNTEIFYIFGNHESSIFKIYNREVQKWVMWNEQGNPPGVTDNNIKVYPFKYRNVTFLGNYVECCVNKQICILQHFPLKVWNYSKIGAYMIHSHNHGGLISSLPNSNEGKILDCGVDVFSEQPVPFDKICDIMSSKDLKTFDKHH